MDPAPPLPIRLRATRLTPADGGGPITGLPQPSETQERLRLLVNVALGAFAAIGVLAWVIPLIWPPPGPVTSGMGLLSIVVSLLCGGMLVVLRHPRPALVLRVSGVGFVVLVAGVMAVTEVALSPELAAGRWGVSGICIWIVLFPLVYPCGPRTTLVAALGCASTVPVTYLFGRFVGLPGETPARLVPWVLPLYFCAGLSVVAALGIHRYRAALAAVRRELREMGRYDLIRRLGQGGMGEVWLARHRLLPRQAAIKFISPPVVADATLTAELTRRFEAEAAAIAQLSSVHTVTLFDFGRSDDGAWYAVMELLDGIDLQQAVEQAGPLPDWRVARILAQACRSLAEAHGRGLVHRDVKPGNLMLCRMGGELDVVKVLDFGLVGLGAGTEPGAGISTVGGSVGYVAPESLLGTALDGRADLYALGCVAWYLLTGRTVFPTGEGVQEECVRHLTEPLPTLLRDGAHDPGLVAVVHELLAKRPDQRPPSADAVRRRLESLPCWQAYEEATIAAWWAARPTPASFAETRSQRDPATVGAE